jgi:hypothetical protein
LNSDHLNAIIGFSELLACEVFGPLGSDRYRDYCRSTGEVAAGTAAQRRRVAERVGPELTSLNAYLQGPRIGWSRRPTATPIKRCRPTATWRA